MMHAPLPDRSGAEAPSGPSSPRGPAEPGPAAPRWRFVDVLRGVALAGILFVNSLDITGLGIARATAGAAPVADPIRELLFMTVQTRFVPIFTFLFGVSIRLVLQGARARTRRPWLVLLRRLVALLAIGRLLGVVYPGNILPEYALYALLLLPLLLLAPRIVLLVLGVALTVAAHLLTGGGNESVTPGLLLAGAAAGAYGLPRVLDRAGRGVAVAFVIAAAATVPALLLQATTPGDARFTRWGADAGLVMAVLYVTGLALLWRTPARSLLRGVFEPLGRMALTNYVTAAVAVAAIAQVVDFGRMTSALPAVGMSVVVLAVQSAASRVWLARFRYGPVEWLWRVVTWWGPVRLRRTAAPAPADRARREDPGAVERLTGS